MDVKAVLNEQSVEPLRQFITANAKIDRLRVVLHVGERQLTERRGRVVPERKRAENRGAGLAAEATGRVMDHTAAKTQVVFTQRPRQRVRELNLMTPQIRRARLSDRERHRSPARVGGGKFLCFPKRNRIAVQVSKARFVQKFWIDDGRVIHLRGPRATRITSRYARRIRSADRVLRIVVRKAIDV